MRSLASPRVLLPALLAPLLAGLVAACAEDGTGPEAPAYVRLLLTDAPTDYIQSAEVWISRVYLQPDDDDPEEQDDGGDPDGGRVVLLDRPENPFRVDLLELRDGVVAELTEPVVVDPDETYEQLRIVVDSAFVTLVEGRTFRDGSSTRALKVPSGSTSGIKVELDEGSILVGEGDVLTVLLDFDVDESFVLQGNPETPAGLEGILFRPVIREMERDVEDGD